MSGGSVGRGVMALVALVSAASCNLPIDNPDMNVCSCLPRPRECGDHPLHPDCPDATTDGGPRDAGTDAGLPD